MNEKVIPVLKAEMRVMKRIILMLFEMTKPRTSPIKALNKLDTKNTV
jgi:hypothetical protein